jgi:hypothetical protein
MSTEAAANTTQEILGPEAHKTVTFKGFLTDPKNMKSLLIFSAVLNVLLFCGFLAKPSGGGTVTPTATLTPIVVRSPSPTPFITESPDAHKANLAKCFSDCESRDFLNLLKDELNAYKALKLSGNYTDLRASKCYGFYTAVAAIDIRYTSYFKAQGCGISEQYDAKSSEYKIGTKYYINSSGNNWDTASIVAPGQTEAVDALDAIMQVQTINTTYEQRGSERVRILTADGTKVNEFNQVVKTSVIIKADESYHLVYFFQSQENSFKQEKWFWDYGVPNEIKAPL